MALTKITSRILDSSGVTILGTISTGVWQGTAINQTYLVGQSGTNTGDETLARINALDITELGTVSSGVWNGTAIASAYLDADTAHLSTTQTFTGAKTFSSNTTFSGTVTVNGTGDSAFNGDLYIVEKKLNISTPSGGNAYVKFSDTNSSAKNWRVGTSLSSRGVFNIYNETDDLLAFNILANGNVGIGTTSPAHKLSVNQNTYASGSDAPEAALGITIGDYWTTTAGAALTIKNAGHRGAVGHASGPLFRADFNNATGMILNKDGNVGIGTASPSNYHSPADNLVIGSSGDNGLTIVSGTSNGGTICFADGTTGWCSILGIY